MTGDFLYLLPYSFPPLLLYLTVLRHSAPLSSHPLCFFLFLSRWDPNYIYNDTGVEDYDFAYDPVFFGPHSFVHPPGSSIPNITTETVKDIFNHFHNDLHIKFAGIRKPRTYSHHNLSNSSGWLLPSSFEVGAGPNNWNMTPGNGWSDWWVPRTTHFLEDGMDFWWSACTTSLRICIVL